MLVVNIADFKTKIKIFLLRIMKTSVERESVSDSISPRERNLFIVIEKGVFNLLG